MVKICVIDDNELDAVSKYEFLLNTDHEISVVMHDGIGSIKYVSDTSPDGEQKWERVKKTLVDEGFNELNLYRGLQNIPEADMYICDGLQGLCLGVADRLGKDKTYIKSGDFFLIEDAKSKGYNTVDNLRSLVEKL